MLVVPPRSSLGLGVGPEEHPRGVCGEGVAARAPCPKLAPQGALPRIIPLFPTGHMWACPWGRQKLVQAAWVPGGHGRDNKGTAVQCGTGTLAMPTPGVCSHRGANHSGGAYVASLLGCCILAASPWGSSPGAAGAHLAASLWLTHSPPPPCPALLGTCVICDSLRLKNENSPGLPPPRPSPMGP